MGINQVIEVNCLRNICLYLEIYWMSENKASKFIHQQKIKNRLCNIELEQAQTATYHYEQYYLHRHLVKKHSDYREISDWANHFDLHPEQQSLPRLSQNKAENDTKRFTFFSSTRYQSSLLSPKNNKNQRLQLSPMVVKFNAKILSQNLQRSKERFMKKLKQDPYLTRYQSLNLLHEQRNKKQTPPKCLELQLGLIKRGNIPQIHPRTQRISSIFRLMKKQETFRIKNKKLVNPENLITTKMKF